MDLNDACCSNEDEASTLTTQHDSVLQVTHSTCGKQYSLKIVNTDMA